ncbi:MAG: Ada metal-binding domain-containing protein, partial [Stenotrophobium sp.]
MKSLPPIAEMQRTYLASDAGYDGVFYLGVRTTGIFCRPSCRARKPLAKNVEFFASVKEAVFAGYRACKRCHPLDAPGKPQAWAQKLLDRIAAAPQQRIRDGDLRGMGIDPARARRYFQQHYGMTFHAYARGQRMGKALQQIRNGTRLDDVAL